MKKKYIKPEALRIEFQRPIALIDNSIDPWADAKPVFFEEDVDETEEDDYIQPWHNSLWDDD